MLSLLGNGLAEWRTRNPEAEQCCAVLAIDLDGFKQVNDRYGHGVGDELLREMARRIAAETRTGDAVGRPGGDEFAICIRGTGADGPGPDAVAQRLRAALHRPVVTSSGPVDVGASIGWVRVPEDAPNLEAALTLADAVHYQAKRAGSGSVVSAGSSGDSVA